MIYADTSFIGLELTLAWITISRAAASAVLSGSQGC
jgi:hypothetical protein